MEPYGYTTQNGYKGLINNKFILFPTEQEYIDYLIELENKNTK